MTQNSPILALAREIGLKAPGLWIGRPVDEPPSRRAIFPI